MTSQRVLPDTLTSVEVARLFRVDVRTVNRWVREKKLLPSYRTPGGHARYQREHILTLMEDNGLESKITDSYHD